MKNWFFLLPIVLVSCGDDTTQGTDEVVPTKNKEAEPQDEVVIAQDTIYETEPYTETTPFPEKVQLECEHLGEDEYGVPHNNVFLRYGEMRKKVGECLACIKIERQDYKLYDIPKNALTACGGWFAGGGEYFYAIRKNETIEVYTGWQDEGQMEENDTTFHWKRTEVITP